MRFRPRHIVLIAIALLTAACDPGDFGNKANNSEPPAAPTVLIQHVQPGWGANGKTIEPKAVLLHWTASYNGGPNAIDAFVQGAKSNKSTYNPKLKSTDPHPEVGQVTVQVAVMGNAKAYQLTPQLNSFARHAKCGNPWAIGIEIEGWNPGHEHYIGKNKAQFNTVVAVVKELAAKYDIPLKKGWVAEDGRSGGGIVTHAQVDAKCKWADDVYAGSGKTDVDDNYLNRVLTAAK